jgi:hypothetical protein
VISLSLDDGATFPNPLKSKIELFNFPLLFGKKEQAIVSVKSKASQLQRDDNSHQLTSNE